MPYQLLQLTEQSRAVLRGEVPVLLRESAAEKDKRPKRSARMGAVVKAPISLDSDALDTDFQTALGIVPYQPPVPPLIGKVVAGSPAATTEPKSRM